MDAKRDDTIYVYTGPGAIGQGAAKQIVEPVKTSGLRNLVSWTPAVPITRTNLEKMAKDAGSMEMASMTTSKPKKEIDTDDGWDIVEESRQIEDEQWVGWPKK